jgi:hypothetical protein
LQFNSYYIAGVTNKKVFFGNFTAPFFLLTTNNILQDSQSVSIHHKLDSAISPKAFRLAIDSPYFYLTHGYIPEYLRGTISEWKAERFLGDSLDYFVESVPISRNSLAIRSVTRPEGEYEIGKKSLGQRLQFNTRLLNKQVDGLFCLEGQLLLDHSTRKLIYIHTYRNEVVIADSSLKLLSRMHTIDTFSQARVKVSRIKNESTLSSPPEEINLAAAVYDDILLVQSNLLSKSEDEELFKKNSVIDAYDLKNDKYIASFYVPNLMGQRIRSFSIHKNDIYVLVGNSAIIYSLPEELKNYTKSNKTSQDTLLEKEQEKPKS